jgi:hypothetical protein
MNQKELEEWICFFTNIHKACKFYYPEDKEFLELLREFPQGITVVGSQKAELLCDFREE